MNEHTPEEIQKLMRRVRADMRELGGAMGGISRASNTLSDALAHVVRELRKSPLSATLVNLEPEVADLRTSVAGLSSTLSQFEAVVAAAKAD